jgi:hypothetical protein
MEEHIINDSNQVNGESEKQNKNKVRYTPAHLKAQNKYREKNREKYNEAQRLLYEKKIQEEEWQKHYLERSRLNNKKWRDKKKEALIERGEYVERKRGRPHKSLECFIKDEHTDHKVYSVKDYFSKITDEEKQIVNEILDNVSEIKQKTIMNKQKQFEKINELKEENKLLTETFLQSEERIKKLEEEIELLKNDEKINELEEENKLLTNTLLQVDNKINKLEEEILFLKIKK